MARGLDKGLTAAPGSHRRQDRRRAQGAGRRSLGGLGRKPGPFREQVGHSPARNPPPCRASWAGTASWSSAASWNTCWRRTGPPPAPSTAPARHRRPQGLAGRPGHRLPLRPHPHQAGRVSGDDLAAGTDTGCPGGIAQPLFRKLLQDLAEARVETVDLLRAIPQIQGRQRGRQARPVPEAGHPLDHGGPGDRRPGAGRAHPELFLVRQRLPGQARLQIQGHRLRDPGRHPGPPPAKPTRPRSGPSPCWAGRSSTGRSCTRTESSPVLVLGDSYTGVFQTVGCRNAGVTAHLAARLGGPVDLIMGWGGGPGGAPEARQARGRYLRSKRLVVWMMSARDLFVYPGRMDGEVTAGCPACSPPACVALLLSACCLEQPDPASQAAAILHKHPSGFLDRLVALDALASGELARRAGSGAEAGGLPGGKPLRLCRPPRAPPWRRPRRIPRRASPASTPSSSTPWGSSPCPTTPPCRLPARAWSWRDGAGAASGWSSCTWPWGRPWICPCAGIPARAMSWCGGAGETHVRNIETLRRGIARSDSFYRETFALGKRPWYSLADARPDQALAALVFNLANLHRSRGSGAARRNTGWPRSAAGVSGSPGEPGAIGLVAAGSGAGPGNSGGGLGRRFPVGSRLAQPGRRLFSFGGFGPGCPRQGRGRNRGTAPAVTGLIRTAALEPFEGPDYQNPTVPSPSRGFKISRICRLWPPPSIGARRFLLLAAALPPVLPATTQIPGGIANAPFGILRHRRPPAASSAWRSIGLARTLPGSGALRQDSGCSPQRRLPDPDPLPYYTHHHRGRRPAPPSHRLPSELPGRGDRASPPSTASTSSGYTMKRLLAFKKGTAPGAGTESSIPRPRR